MNRTTRLLLVLLASAAVAYAGPINVFDNSLADWGVYVGDSNTTQYLFDKGVNLVCFHEEDSNDNSNSYWVGPNYGGQNYDAELLAIAIQNDPIGNLRLYVAVLSGQRPDNGFFTKNGTNYYRYGPGDLRITMASGDVYGLEVGGAAPWDLDPQILGGDLGSTYALSGGGYTTGHSYMGTQRAGTLWKNPTWILDPIVPQEQVQLQFVGGSPVWATSNPPYDPPIEYRFNTMPAGTSQHGFFEASIPVSVFGGDSVWMVEWRPSCGNDELICPIPEPGSMALTGLGLLGFVLYWRRRKRA